jgi:hypothetical protein
MPSPCFSLLFSDTFLILFCNLSVTSPYRKVSERYQMGIEYRCSNTKASARKSGEIRDGLLILNNDFIRKYGK